MLLGMRDSYRFRQLKTYAELQKLFAKRQSEQGFTIIESLMAIIVITVLVVSITPPIFLAVGTRVQNQKAEQAMQLAQLQVDQVRVLIERGIYSNSDLPPDGGTGVPTTVAAPTSFITCTTAASSNACAVDINNDGKPEFYVQTFRTQAISSGTPSVVIAFQMGVRVYSALAQGQAGLQTTQAALKFTTEQGNQRKYP